MEQFNYNCEDLVEIFFASELCTYLCLISLLIMDKRDKPAIIFFTSSMLSNKRSSTAKVVFPKPVVLHFYQLITLIPILVSRRWSHQSKHFMYNK